MKAEQIILSFIAVLIGLFATGVIFFIYQTTRTVPPQNLKTVSTTTPSSPPQSSLFLTVDVPKDEDVFDRKIITVSGKTSKDAIVVISTNTDDLVIEPTSIGTFATTVTIRDDYNKIDIVAVSPNGDTAKTTKTVTFSTETF